TLAAAVAVLAVGPAAALAQQPIKVTAAALKATAGTPFTGTVATVNASCQNFTGGQVGWGDGTASPADGKAVSLKTDPGNANRCLVQGAHTYAAAGTFATKVSVGMAAGATFS